MKKFQSFREFYPYYLSEHRNKTCRQLHALGSLAAILLIIFGTLNHKWELLILAPIVGYGCAWIGHFFFEKNRPAAFHYPIYSLIGDCVLIKDILIRRKTLDD